MDKFETFKRLTLPQIMATVSGSDRDILEQFAAYDDVKEAKSFLLHQRGAFSDPEQGKFIVNYILEDLM